AGWRDATATTPSSSASSAGSRRLRSRTVWPRPTGGSSSSTPTARRASAWSRTGSDPAAAEAIAALADAPRMPYPVRMTTTTEALMRTDLPLPNRRQGKVRDVYEGTLDDGRPVLLIVASDRVSAFDVVMPNGIPGKGVVLTQISRFWFDLIERELG